MTQKTMEPLKRGKHFRLLEENELESVLEILEKHLPFSIKVSSNMVVAYSFARQLVIVIVNAQLTQQCIRFFRYFCVHVNQK